MFETYAIWAIVIFSIVLNFFILIVIPYWLDAEKKRRKDRPWQTYQ
jgi:hypothetical protein